MLRVDTWPELRDPVLVFVLTGWVDAGGAGSAAAELLEGQLGAARAFAQYELDDLVDLQQTRPMVEIDEGHTRRVVWPSIRFVAGRRGRDLVLATGPEPSLRWPTVTTDLVQVALRLGVTTAVGLGAIPAVVSHRQPVPILATASDDALAREIGAFRSDYEGPTGLQTILQHELGQAGIRSIGVWAQVPHYVSGNQSPPAVRALLERLHELTGIDADLSPLDEDCASYVDKVEEGLAERPDVADLVAAIESERIESRDLPSADELASEIERFLRDQ